jgi:hypothetical protein
MEAKLPSFLSFDKVVPWVGLLASIYLMGKAYKMSKKSNSDPIKRSSKQLAVNFGFDSYKEMQIDQKSRSLRKIITT